MDVEVESNSEKKLLLDGKVSDDVVVVDGVWNQGVAFVVVENNTMEPATTAMIRKSSWALVVVILETVAVVVA